MRGFKAGSKPKAPRSIKSGTIQGPGTGISDDVKATVEGGSYVMPADSTAQIGAEQLQGMAAPVDVNLSNGEQLMSPEQVHAVGVQTLDAMKNATHVPAAQQQGVKGFQPRGNEQGKPELFFADGGVVEEPRKKQTSFDITNTPAAQRAAGIITNAEAAQRAAGVAPATPAATPPTPSATTMYGNSNGVTGKGFMPSSSTAVVPAGPVTGTSLVPVNQPTAGAPEAEAPKASARPEPDYRARAETMGRAKADSAAYEAHRATQDARFEAAKNQPAAPEKAPGRVRSAVNGKAGKGFGVMAAIPATVESAADDSTARYAQRFGMDEPTGDGSAGDILKFTALRALGFASDLGNALTMGQAGNLYRDNQGEQAPGAAVSAPSQQAASAAPGQAQSQQAAPSAPAPAAPAAPQGNGYQQTGINGIVGKKDENGQYSFTNEAQAVDGAAGQLRGVAPSATVGRDMASGTMMPPDGARVLASGSNAPDQELTRLGSSANLGNGVGTFSQAEPGSAAEAIARFERANQEREKMIQASRRGQIGEGGGRVTVVRDSSRDGAAGRAAIAAASTPYRGSPGGQLTANQLRTLAGLQESGERNATDLARERIQQEGADGRTAITEAGANQRFAQSNALDKQRTDAEVESKGFAARSAQRIENLYEQYDKAKPEDRAVIAEQLRVLSGKSEGSLKDNFIKVKSPIFNAEGDYVGDQEELVDLRGGQSAALPPIAENPQALAIKNNQNLSRDERAKQLRALGYQ